MNYEKPLKAPEPRSESLKKSIKALQTTNATELHWAVKNNIGQAFANALNQSVFEEKNKR